MTDIDIVRDALAGVLPREQDPFAALARIGEQLRLAHIDAVNEAAENERLRRIEETARDVLTRIESREPPSWLKAQLDEASLNALRAALEEER